MSEDKLPTVPEWHDIVMRCDGECHSRGECVGEVKTYEIVQSTSSTRWNGLRFNYCETAFLHDCDNGFVLNSVEDAVPSA